MNARVEKTQPLEFELTLISGTTVATGITLACSVRRQSDGFWWDGSAFTNTTYTTNNMTELTGDDGLEGRYVFTIPAQNVEEAYLFRARHTFAGDSNPTMFEVELVAYSEAAANVRRYSEALPGEVVEIKAFLEAGGVVQTGESPVISIRRQSDGFWWNGIIWHIPYSTTAMVESTGNVAVEGEYVYLFNVPATPSSEKYHWSIKQGTPPRYTKGEIRMADINVHHISASREAATDFRAAVITVVRGKAVAGTLTLTEMTTDLAETTVNRYRGRAMYWEDGPLKDEQTEILASLGPVGGGKLTFKQVTVSPVAGNSFVIV